MNKSIKIILNYFLGPILALILCWVLYKQILAQPNLSARWHEVQNAFTSPVLWLILALMLLNYGLEAWKWQLLIRPIQPMNFIKTLKAVWAGCSVTMITPNRMGEYGGRILFLQEENRAPAISTILLGSIAQFIITLLIGFCGLCFFIKFDIVESSALLHYLGGSAAYILTAMVGLSTVLLMILYFKAPLLTKHLRPFRWKWLNKMIAVVSGFDQAVLFQVLLLALLRYIVFAGQFILALQLFDAAVHTGITFMLISIFYLLMAVVPTIGFTELPVRALSAVALFGIFNHNTLGIQAATLFIWIVNIVLPALLGTVIIARTKWWQIEKAESLIPDNVQKTAWVSQLKSKMKFMGKYGLMIVAACSVLLLSFIPKSLSQNEKCGMKNTTFKSGEKVVMRVYYSTMGAYVGAGEAEFTTNLTRYNGRPVYHCVGVGSSYSFFDNFFKVRDRYESYIDTATLMPYKFIRNVEEGSYKKYNNISFNRSANTATTTTGVYVVPDCIQDVVSAVYYARNINYDAYKPGDRIPFQMFLDDEIYNLYIRYLGKVNIKTRYGKFKAYKIKPLLVKGTIFEGGEHMNAYFSADQNKLLLRVESPITVGKIVVDMMGYNNLRYPLTSLERVR